MENKEIKKNVQEGTMNESTEIKEIKVKESKKDLKLKKIAKKQEKLNLEKAKLEGEEVTEKKGLFKKVGSKIGNAATTGVQKIGNGMVKIGTVLQDHPKEALLGGTALAVAGVATVILASNAKNQESDGEEPTIEILNYEINDAEETEEIPLETSEDEIVEEVSEIPEEEIIEETIE